MQPASAEGSNSDTGRALRRYGPIAAIAVVALVVIGVVIAGGGDDASAPVTSDGTTEPDATDNAPDDPTTTDDDTATTEGGSETTPDTEPPSTDPDAPVESPLPEGVMSFSVADELGLDVDFGERCDTESGRVKVQTFFAPECYEPFTGDNGGATARGVTEDTITIVQWVSQDQDPILEFITSAILNDDTNADDEATLRGMIEYYETYYETYGRSVELIVVEGSGARHRRRRSTSRRGEDRRGARPLHGLGRADC